MVIPFLADRDVTIYVGDALEVLRELPDGSVDAVVTSPPYLDARPEYEGPPWFEYPAIFEQLARVVTGGMLWNVGRLWRTGVEQLWWLELIKAASFSEWEHWDTGVWVKPNANPIRGHLFADSHEYVLAFGRDGVRFNTDALRTEYSAASLPRMARRWINGRGVKGDDRSDQHGRAVNELGARGRSFFVSPVGREKGNPHPAPMPVDLADVFVAGAAWPDGVVLDLFGGSGTTAVAARRQGRRAILIEKSADYAMIAAERLQQQTIGTAA